MQPGQKVHLTSFAVDFENGGKFILADVTPDANFTIPLILRIPNVYEAPPNSLVLGEAEDPSRLRSLSHVVWRQATDDGLYTETKLREARGVGFQEPGGIAFSWVFSARADPIAKETPLGVLTGNSNSGSDDGQTFRFSICGELTPSGLPPIPPIPQIMWAAGKIAGLFFCPSQVTYLWQGAPPGCTATAEVEAYYNLIIGDAVIRAFAVSFIRNPTTGTLERFQGNRYLNVMSFDAKLPTDLVIRKATEVITCR